MSENIRVSEVSDILRKQLEGINTNVQLDEIGTVLQVSDGVVRIYGLRNAEANELLEFDNGIKAIVMNLEEDNVGAVLLGPTDRIKEGFIVKRTKRIASIRVGESMLGRVIDPLGEPLDGKGLIGGELYEMPLERKAPGVIYRQPVNQPLQTGLKAVDAMIPIGRGQRELIIGDRQTGKTSIAIDTIINQRNNFLANGELPQQWDEKNREEQEYVAAYIRKQLRSLGISPTEKGPYPAFAGALSHLKTDFHFSLNDSQRLGDLLKLLHPTPAVCGLPKEEAYRFILDNEGYDRSYYSGFIGWLRPEGRTDLYVNLR